MKKDQHYLLNRWWKEWVPEVNKLKFYETHYFKWKGPSSFLNRTITDEIGVWWHISFNMIVVFHRRFFSGDFQCTTNWYYWFILLILSSIWISKGNSLNIRVYLIIQYDCNVLLCSSPVTRRICRIQSCKSTKERNLNFVFI